MWSHMLYIYIFFTHKSGLCQLSNWPQQVAGCLIITILCMSLCSTVTAECAWNGGLKGSCSDSSIWVQHSCLIMSHRGGGNPSVTRRNRLLLNDAAHVVGNASVYVLCVCLRVSGVEALVRMSTWSRSLTCVDTWVQKTGETNIHFKKYFLSNEI